MGDITFVGLAQYQYLLTDSRFWTAVGNTLIIWFLSTIPMLFLALVIAFLLHSNIRFKALPGGVLRPQRDVDGGDGHRVRLGVLRQLRAGQLGPDCARCGPVAWLSSSLGIKVTISVMVIWRFTGYNAIIYLAGLQSIPTELYDAARVDGAGSGGSSPPSPSRCCGR